MITIVIIEALIVTSVLVVMALGNQEIARAHAPRHFEVDGDTHDA